MPARSSLLREGIRREGAHILGSMKMRLQYAHQSCAAPKAPKCPGGDPSVQELYEKVPGLHSERKEIVRSSKMSHVALNLNRRLKTENIWF